MGIWNMGASSKTNTWQSWSLLQLEYAEDPGNLQVPNDPGKDHIRTNGKKILQNTKRRKHDQSKTTSPSLSGQMYVNNLLRPWETTIGHPCTTNKASLVKSLALLFTHVNEVIINKAQGSHAGQIKLAANNYIRANPSNAYFTTQMQNHQHNQQERK